MTEINQLAEAPTTLRLNDEHIGEVGKRRPVRDETGEADLTTARRVDAERERPGDGAADDVLRDAGRPVRFAEHAMNQVQIQARWVRARHELPALPAAIRGPGSRSGRHAGGLGVELRLVGHDCQMKGAPIPSRSRVRRIAGRASIRSA